MSSRTYWFQRANIASKKSLAVLGVLALAFLVLGILTRYSFLQHLDLKVTREVQEHSGFPLDQVMIAASFMGNVFVVAVLNLMLGIGLVFQNHRRAALFLFLTLLAAPIDVLLKGIWERSRPDRDLVTVVVRESGYSFPSGHAMVGTAFYGGLAILAWIHLKEKNSRKPVTVALALFPLLISVSRVYRGAHWFSDVFAGTTMSLLLLYLLTIWYRSKPEEIAKPIAPEG